MGVKPHAVSNPDKAMAKKENSQQVEEASKVEETVQAQEAPKTEETVQEAPKVEKATKLPDYADKVLKMYPEHEKLYVSRQGGGFTVDTPDFVRGNAKLFENPYYNNK